jgi:hypothetical protein
MNGFGRDSRELDERVLFLRATVYYALPYFHAGAERTPRQGTDARWVPHPWGGETQ